MQCNLIPMPVSPIEVLTHRFRDILHLPDPGALYTLMGAVAANMLEGNPVWLMLVGAPSCGKTELLNSLLGLDHMVEAADLASEAAFLSATATKDRAKDATGGLLRETGDHGGLILNDFTSLLSKSNEKIATIMAVLRETYSGRWTRHVGSEGGKKIQWAGRLAVLAGCTNYIDQSHQISSGLGERWIFYRYDHRDVFPEVSMATSGDRGEWRMTLKDLVTDFFADLGLQFGQKIPHRTHTKAEQEKIYRLATMASRCRSSVMRDSYTKDIIAAPEIELGIRLSTVLSQLLFGMERIGVPEPARWRLLAKVSVDSMPLLRKRVIDTVAKQPVTIAELEPILGCSLTTTRRVVEDLKALELVKREDSKVALTDLMRDYHKQFFPKLDSNIPLEFFTAAL